ncbi:MAG: isocitrate lyase/phosphoenolpyruvate mutase family protein [Alphaproteobacteria bacterium]|nr:isocitrate lyase/phosphoenolpyruvate mutase family protein [Alphaproteobacteria bacterium]
MTTQASKASAFRALHESDGAFIIPNPWDIGTARILDQLGYKALATTSAGYAFSRGQRDNMIARDEMMSHVSDIVNATDLPVSGDLVNGFGDAPETVAETIRMAAEAGLVSASIEDSTGRAEDPLYDIELSVERIRAAVEAAREMPIDLMVTGRAENFLVGHPDLKDTIQRLQAYQDAGADILYAPGLTSMADIATVVREVDRPLNVVMGLKGPQASLSELADIGVKRVSVGSALSRAALGAFLRASKEMIERGTFSFAEEAVPFPEISALMQTE